MAKRSVEMVEVDYLPLSLEYFLVEGLLGIHRVHVLIERLRQVGVCLVLLVALVLLLAVPVRLRDASLRPGALERLVS